MRVRVQKFQFLIGTIKTICSGLPHFTAGKFQFLIGTIKTIKQQLIEIAQAEVSIPYRYDKNTNLNGCRR